MLYVFVCVPHRYGEARPGEHEDVVPAVPDRRDALVWDLVPPGQQLDDGALVRQRVRDVEVVGLRRRCGDVLAELVGDASLGGRDRVDEDLLGKMKRGAYLVNTARGKICDRDAIARDQIVFYSSWW